MLLHLILQTSITSTKQVASGRKRWGANDSSLDDWDDYDVTSSTGKKQAPIYQKPKPEERQPYNPPQKPPLDMQDTDDDFFA